MSPGAKQAVIRALLPELDRLEVLVDYGSMRMRELSAERGIKWEALSDAERQDLVDAWLHETQSASWPPRIGLSLRRRRSSAGWPR